MIWIEGEQAVKKQLVDNAGLNDVNPDELSGGKWICSFSHEKQPTGTVEYAVGIPQAGRYHLWVRAVGGTGLVYRLDGAQEAVAVAIDKGKDPIPVAADGNPFYPPRAEWFDLGALELGQGKHDIIWYLGGLKEKVRWGGMDCFVLASGAFTPNGKYKPGEKLPEPIPAFQPGQAWDFVPAADKLDPSAVLDLRYLNEKAAGEHGFIRLSPDGNGFLRGDGQPIRFWAASPSFPPETDLAARKHDSQFLAKRGVNFARVWCKLYRTEEGSKITDVDEKALDDIFKTVAALKSAGIYSIINPYWAVSVKVPRSWGADRSRHGLPRGTAVLRADDAEGVQGVAQGPVHDEEPVHRPAARRGPRGGHRRDPERGQSAVVGLQQHQGRCADHAAAIVRGFPQAEVRLAGRAPARHGRTTTPLCRMRGTRACPVSCMRGT